MKKKLLKLMAIVMIAGVVLAGCGADRPSGVYEYDGVAFDFGKNTVIVSEGSATVTCDYKMNKDGTIVFELEGDEITCTYDAEHDIINFYGDQYSKE